MVCAELGKFLTQNYSKGCGWKGKGIVGSEDHYSHFLYL